MTRLQSVLNLMLIALAALVFAPSSQPQAQLANSISGNDLQLPRSLPLAQRKKLLNDLDKRCTRGQAHAKVCCFIIAVEACKDPVQGIGCDLKRLVGYDGCLEEACEYSCPIPEALETLQQYQNKPKL